MTRGKEWIPNGRTLLTVVSACSILTLALCNGGSQNYQNSMHSIKSPIERDLLGNAELPKNDYSREQPNNYQAK